jgi:hypothetical protein
VCWMTTRKKFVLLIFHQVQGYLIIENDCLRVLLVKSETFLPLVYFESRDQKRFTFISFITG